MPFTGWCATYHHCGGTSFGPFLPCKHWDGPEKSRGWSTGMGARIIRWGMIVNWHEPFGMDFVHISILGRHCLRPSLLTKVLKAASRFSEHCPYIGQFWWMNRVSPKWISVVFASWLSRVDSKKIESVQPEFLWFFVPQKKTNLQSSILALGHGPLFPCEKRWCLSFLWLVMFLHQLYLQKKEGNLWNVIKN